MKFALFLLSALLFVPNGLKAEMVEPSYEDLHFDVFRDGSEFGSHRIQFEKRGDGKTAVSIDIDLAAGILGFDLYNYEHHNEELWDGNKLVRLNSTTNNDGEDLYVDASKQGDKLEIDASKNDGHAELGIFSTSYWNYNIVKQSKLLNSQNGEVIDIEFLPLEDEKPGHSCYRSKGKLKLDICYEEESKKWASLAFEIKGHNITYKPSQKD